MAGHTSAMIALELERECPVAQSLAQVGTTPLEELHCTVVYLGGVADLGLSRLRGVRAAVKLFAESWGRGPLKGTVGGYGRFRGTRSSGGADVYYASYDAPDLPEMREGLMRVVRAAGVSPPRNHGYTPHITLAYLDRDAPLPGEIKVAGEALDFRALTLYVGDDRERFTLSGGQT